ncbi:hypothetical protein JB92DRAFT_3066712 [Gautieria morchelliformis]|nr:hypothetical protein JB92DRAFT_3066712 [Gautieria morchelliformis]
MSRGTRPPSFTLGWRALLSLPMRICNPPPAASRVRSCKVTPLVKVTLDDVLNKRHLPPLTLKDFEEWLVFVEGNPQYLYFILWLKEYESRYAAWLADSGCALPDGSPTNSTTTLGDDADTPCDRELSYINLIPSSAPLALFFTRAKQTFLDPASSSPYALGQAALLALAPSTHSLAPSIPQFRVPSDNDNTGYIVGSLPPSLATQPHPHPKELAPLAIYARKILKECLQRFAETACQNVGTRRAWCGIAGGTFLILVFGILPVLVAFFFASCRWWRAVGWFGCWLGGTIVVSSFHGICMMIYVFGDLRQLRSFELARPSISGPRAIARARPKLKSFFTREGEEEQTDNGNPGKSTGSGGGTGTDPAPSQPPARHAVELPKPLEARQNIGEEKGTKVSPGKGPWSPGCASHTSTGTPIVHLGASVFRFGVGTGTTESEASPTIGSGDIVVGGTNDGGAQLNDDDFGIEISPVYYYSGQGPTAGDDEKTEHRESVRSAVGRLMQWVLGRGSVGTGTDLGSRVGGKAVGVASENMGQLQSHTRSHVGTFGIKSWRAGLGSLPERNGGEGQDLEKGLYVTQTAQEETLDDPAEVVSEDATLELDDTLTAEFITHDYPGLEPGTVPDPQSAPTSLPGSGTEKAQTPVEKKRESSFVSPVKFDFDKLPAAAVARRMSSPSTFSPFPVSPCPVSGRAPTPPQPPLPHPSPAFYAHPGTRLTTPTPALSLVIPGPRPVSTAFERQWWDTCPRHPAVEATLGSAAPAIPTHNHPLPTSTRTTSVASSDVHSRVRVDVCPVPTVPASAPCKSAVRPQPSFSSSRSTGSWQTRFRRVMAVPAFGPLTRVLEPVVSRGQWEIVVRSACAAAIGAWIFIGCLVALPEAR